MRKFLKFPFKFDWTTILLTIVFVMTFVNYGWRWALALLGLWLAAYVIAGVLGAIVGVWMYYRNNPYRSKWNAFMYLLGSDRGGDKDDRPIA